MLILPALSVYRALGGFTVFGRVSGFFVKPLDMKIVYM